MHTSAMEPRKDVRRVGIVAFTSVSATAYLRTETSEVLNSASATLALTWGGCPKVKVARLKTLS